MFGLRGARSRVALAFALVCAVALVAFGASAIGQSEVPPATPPPEFPDLTRDQAVALASAQFPDVVGDSASVLPDAPAGGHLSFVDDRTVRVVGADGVVDGVVVSSLPLRAVDDSGDRVPVDLGLESSGAGGVLEPSNPLVDVSVHSDLDQGVELGGTGISLVPSGSSVAADAVQAGSLAFFANAGTDTDFAVKPIASGFETFSTLRSSDSPQELAYRFELPAGVSAQVSDDGQRVELRRTDGTLAASMGIPVAYDAAGTAVPVSWLLDGATVRVSVNHQGAGLVYPVIVDPVVDYYDWASAGALSAGWTFANPSGADFQSFFGTSGFGRGLYIRNLRKQQGLPWPAFTEGQQAYWSYRAPGASKVVRVEWSRVNHDQDVPGNRTCVVLGIAQSPAPDAGWEPGSSAFVDRCGPFAFALPPNGSGQYTTTVGAGTGEAVLAHPGNAARFGVRISHSDNIGYFTSAVGSALVYLEDTDAPSITEDDVPQGWGDWPTSREVRVSAHDAGLGVKTASLSAPGWAGSTGTSVVPASCQSAAVCAPDYSFRLAGGVVPTVANLPEGDNEIAATASDPQQHTTSRMVHVKVDRTAPALALSGALYDQRTQTLAPGSYVLQADASDADPAHATSGVRSLEVTLDGQSVPGGAAVTQSCDAGSCALAHEFTLDLSALTGGEHTLTVTATDGAGHETSRSLTLTFTTIRLASTPATFDLTPRVTTSLEGAQAGGLPGEPLGYRARIENTGGSLRLGAALKVANLGAADASVASSYVALESRATTTGAWTTLAVHADTESGYTPHDPGPAAPDLTSVLTSSPAAGVTYPAGGGLAGTQLAPGSQGAWTLAASLELTAAQAAALVDAARNGQVRLVTHAELANTGGTRVAESDAVSDITSDVVTQDAAVLHATIPVTGLDGAQRTITETDAPALASIAPGTQALVALGESVPAVAAKGAGESDQAYLARLQAADGQALSFAAQVTGSAAGTSTRDGQGQPVAGPARPLSLDPLATSITRRVPVAAIAKIGPEAATPDSDVTYTVSLENLGSAQATIGAFTDSVDDGPPAAITGGPATLDAGASASASVAFHVPAGRPDGPLSDVAAVEWTDAQGNQYGPLTDRWTTSVQAPVGVNAPALDMTVPTTLASATSFLYSGANPVQQGVAAGTILAKRASVIRGKVLDTQGAPLPSVSVAVADHPEFGTSTSQVDGEIYLAVNGGGPLTVRLTKDGYLPVERVVQAPWNDYAHLEDDVRLTPLDQNVTAVDLGVLSAGQVARGSVQTDIAGSRQATMIFPPDTSASLVMPDGSQQPVSQLHVRATEYTVGPNGKQAMPGMLPPQSAYTYAADFTADEAISAGASSIEFSRPVAGYIENFLEFPVGTPVPSGYYDSKAHAWVAQPDGRVIKVLSVTGGQASVDVDGSGAAASATQLTALGIDSAELTSLASLYTAGQSLWRTPMRHFTPYDWNYSWTIATQDAIEPDVVTPVHHVDDPCHASGSDIECENQTLGEDYDLAGTPHALDYRSSRTIGRAADNDSLDLEVTPASIPTGLQQINASIEVGGRTFSQTYAPAANLRWNFKWDRKDAFGRRMQGGQVARIRLSYEYPIRYTTVSCDSPCSGGGASGQVSRFGGFRDTTTLGLSVRDQAELGSEGTDLLGGWDATAASDALGGWTLDSHHTYDPGSRTVFLGDGGKQSATSVNRVVSPLAALPGSGNRPLASGPDGSVYAIAGNSWHQVYKVSPSGTVSLFAGAAQNGYSGPGPTPALQAQFGTLTGIAVGPDGSVYLSDLTNKRVRRISPAGMVTTIAGNGTSSGPEQGAALTVTLQAPGGLDVAPDGSVYVAILGYTFSGHGGRVMKIAPDGYVSRFVGRADGIWFPYTDGLRANETPSDYVTDVAVMADGSVLYSDAGSGFRAVRRVSRDGTVSTLAGGLEFASTVDVAPDGSVYIGANGRIRRVLADGSMTTVAGNGTMVSEAASKKGQPAAQVRVGPVQGLAVGNDGSVLFVDAPASTIIRIASPMPGLTDSQFAVPSQDGSLVYRFEKDGRHLSTVDALTGQTVETFAYDSAGRLTSSTDGDGNATTIERSPTGVAGAIVGPYGQRTLLTHDTNGHLSQITDPGGQSTLLDVSADGLLGSLTDPRGNVHAFTYDSEGRLTRDSDAAGAFSQLDRVVLSPRSRKVTLTSALGRQTEHRYTSGADGTVTRQSTTPDGLTASTVTRQNGSVTATSPDGTQSSATQAADPRFGMQAPFTSQLSVTTPGGLSLASSQTRSASLTNPDDPLSLTSLSYTSTLAGSTLQGSFARSTLTTAATSPAGRSTSARVDGQGRPTLLTVPGITPIAFSYDARGRLAQITQGTRTSSTTYDTLGRVASSTDPLGRTTFYAYDASDRLIDTQLPSGAHVGFAYDASGNLTGLTPPSRPAHAFGYDAADRPERYTPPPAGTGAVETSYAYNADHQPTSVTRANGDVISLGYDAAGRARSVSMPGREVTFAYDAAGRLGSSEVTGGERGVFSYDGVFPTSESWSGPVAGTTSRTYDTHGRVASSSVNGSAVALSYDADSLLTGAGALSLTRDPQNGLLSGSSLGAVSTSVSWDAFGAPTTLDAQASGSGVFHESLTRDELGRITSKAETTPSGSHVTQYGYWPDGQLRDVIVDGVTAAHYDYDQNGNRTAVTRGPFTTGSSYDDQDRLTQSGTTSYTYDQAGDLTSKTDSASGQSTTYRYDAAGDLTRVDLPDGRVVTYTTDPGGNRIERRVDGTLTHAFLYSREQQGPAAQLDASGQVVSRFVYATSGVVPDYMTRAGATYRIIRDHLGSPRLVINTQTGDVAAQLEFDEYGRTLTDTNPGLIPFGYAGGLKDPDSGLVRMGARDYDPQTGRFTTKDPIGFSGGDTSLYAYVAGDPVNQADPSGLYGITDLIDDVVPDPVSNAAAGLLAGASFGISNKIAGINGQCVGAGYGTGSLLSWFVPVGALAKGLRTGYKLYKARNAAKAPRLLGPGTSIGSHVAPQLGKRGWTERLIDSTIARPARTVATRDTRHIRGGGRMDDPATAYYSQRGGYVVRNDRTGDIVQVSDRTDPNWIAPWD